MDKIVMSKDTGYPPIEQVTSATIKTAQAAYYLNRSPQTLRNWACYKNGPLQPRSVHARLAWSVDEIKKLMGGE